MEKSEIRLGSNFSLSARDRLRFGARMLKLQKETLKESSAVTSQVASLNRDYRRALGTLLGRGGMRQIRDLRADLADLPRLRRIRAADRLLEDIGLDRPRAERLRRDYLVAATRLLEKYDIGLRPTRNFPGHQCSPWVTYTAPYDGWLWSYSWERSDEADDPVLARYLNHTTGDIGSSIRTRLSEADDDDFVNVEYYTGINVWHTALEPGNIEAYVAFEFRASDYSGKVQDEFGFSSATYTQWATARFRVGNALGQSDSQESRIFNYIRTDWGNGWEWGNYVSQPRDIHWYYFRTAASFGQGEPLLLEGGIRNVTWFHANDESITTADNLDLRLDRIMVRSCPAAPIL
jgi:hypothetical protein